ncbi:DNA-binding MarR family transcriptional regulator [Pseudonocardia sediminis]|uniref:DNA-binding MarR family transcriptional regulator n=1 Tax=Pseudonocardia sediminis TaxID=1397368 RepID=A0A4Q7US87_PSEST|nr:MarR family transcriptional regulator [Pseudonocardia sediminis]RZT84506.1 DNA-binding MarR family transcriptional regulator [Pseudonocardia sediminis]
MTGSHDHDRHAHAHHSDADSDSDSDSDSEEITDAEEILDLLARLEIGSMLFRQALTQRLGITGTEHLMLDLLIQHGDLTGSQLVGMTGLTSGAISGLADRLEQEGLLSRSPDPSDGRRRVLRPTDAARRHIETTIEKLRLRRKERVAVELLHGLDDADLDAVTIFLSRATDRAFRQARALRLWQREPSRWRSRGSTSRPAPTRSAPG